MKKFFLLSVLIAAVSLSACKLSETAYYDDVYTVSSDAQYAAKKNTTTTYNTTSTPTTQAESVDYEPEVYNEGAVYYDNGNNATVYTETAPAYSESDVEYASDGNTYITNNYYYDPDDYYDFYYTSRLRRFHSSRPTYWG